MVNYGTPIKQTLFLSLLQGFQQNESVRCSAVVRCGVLLESFYMCRSFNTAARVVNSGYGLL